MRAPVVTACFIFLLLFPFSLCLSQTKPAQARPTQAPAGESSLLKEAKSLAAQGKYDKILQLLGPKADKLTRKGLFVMAEAHEKLDNGLAAINTYKTVLALNEKDLEARIFIARVQKKLNKETDAINTLKDALEINKLYEPAHFALVDLYEKLKRIYPLRVQLEDMEKFMKGPKLARVKAQLCKINLQERFHAQAKEKCVQAIEQDPKNPDNYVHLGTAFKETGDMEQASKHLHRAADSFRKSESAQYHMGQFYLETKKILKAHEYFLRAKTADPKAVRALTALGFTSVELQKFQMALEQFNEACAVDRNTEKDLRRAANIVRQLKLEPWLDKFEAAAEKCSGLDVFN
jgi:tetratricopeptide (TPR) repeat protein